MDAGRLGAARWLAVAWFWLGGNITAAPGVFWERGGRFCGLASILPVGSCGACKGKDFPISSGFRRWMDNISVRLDWPDGREGIGGTNL